jgi:hypothetical protein
MDFAKISNYTIEIYFVLFYFGQRLYIKISTFLLSTLNLVINKLLLSDRKKLGSKLVFQIILFNAV